MNGLPLDEWRLVLSALCAGSPAWIGTPHEPDTWTLIHPTGFGWLRSVLWLPELALFDLAEPGTMPAAAWEPLCGPLSEAPATTEGRFLIGRFPVPETGRSARLSLITDTASMVRTVRVVIEHRLPSAS